MFVDIGYTETNLCPICLDGWLSPESTQKVIHIKDVGAIKAEAAAKQVFTANSQILLYFTILILFIMVPFTQRQLRHCSEQALAPDVGET